MSHHLSPVRVKPQYSMLNAATLHSHVYPTALLDDYKKTLTQNILKHPFHAAHHVLLLRGMLVILQPVSCCC